MSLATILNRANPLLKKANYIISCFLLIVFFFVLMTHLSKEIKDLDIWLHLKTGEQILQNREIPLTDHYSFSKGGGVWVNHEWLFQILAFAFYNKFGFDGLIVMQNLVFLALFFIVLAMGLRNRNFILASVVLYLLLLNSSYRFTVRPDMFSALFLVIFLYILLQKPRYLNLLPLLQVIWSNLHGFFFLGPLVILIFCLTQKNKKLWPIFFFTLFATLINPQFVKGALYPLTTLFSLAQDRFVFEFIQELKKPVTLKSIFNINDWTFYKSLILVSAFSFRFNQKKPNKTLFLLWLLFLLLSLSAIRNIIYFACVAAVAIFYNVKERLGYDDNLSSQRFEAKKYYYIGRYSLIFALGFFMLKNSMLNIDCHYFDFDRHAFKSCLWGLSQRNFPRKAVDFVLKENLPQSMFNDFNAGSYLVGRTFPARRVFIDGRTELYGNDFLRAYEKATKGETKAIQELIHKYNLECFFLSMAMSNFDEKLAKYLLESPEWKVVYFDETALIFVKDISKNRNLIDKFYIDLNSWRAPKEEVARIPSTIIFPYKNTRRGQVLKELGCFEAAISEARQALKIMPNCIEAFELLGDSYLGLEKYELTVENLRIAVILAPGAEALRNKFALALYKSGYLDEAAMQLTKLINSNPQGFENYKALAKVYRNQGKLKKAEAEIAKACGYSKNRDFESLKLWAQLLRETDQNQKSLWAYNLCLKLQPENTEIKEIVKNLEKIL